MFLDDLLNGQPVRDVRADQRPRPVHPDWGFTAGDVRVPVRWWHGDDDHVVPFAHGRHFVERLPDAALSVIDGESHLGGLGIAEEVLTTLMELRPRRGTRPRTAPLLRKTRNAGIHPPHLSQWGHNYTPVTRTSRFAGDRWGRRISRAEVEGGPR